MSEPSSLPEQSAPARKPTLSKRLQRSRGFHWLITRLVRGLVALMQRLGPERSANIASAVMQFLAPLIREHRLAARNIAAAFPEKSAEERRRIQMGTWDNLARTSAEYIHLDALAGQELVIDGEGPLMMRGSEYFVSLRDDNKPAIIFAAHLANWELLAVVATRYGLPVTALFRPPANMGVAEDLLKKRRAVMGGLVANSRGATFELGAALERGEHLGLLVDQKKRRGPKVPFFGRMAETNPLAARLARAYECPVHGARSIRLPGGRFIIEMTPPLNLPRDAEGRIDVAGATAMITKVVEGWVREYPEQWLWLHDRWGQ